MAKVEITIIKEDIKKDLTNFLIGVASAGISEDVFPELAALITKSLSPTIDISNFADELIDLLKRGNDIKNNKGVDFAPLIESIQKGSPFLDAEGDSIYISTLIEEDRRAHNEEIINAPLNKLSDNKGGSTILDTDGESFTATSEINGKEEKKISNIVQESAIDPSIDSRIESFITTDTNKKEQTSIKSFVTSDVDDKFEPKENEINPYEINPLKDNTLGAYRKEGAPVKTFVTEDLNNKISSDVENVVTENLNNKTETDINEFITSEINNKTKTEVTIEANESLDNKKEIDLKNKVRQLASEIIEYSNKTPRRQKQLEVLLYNAIPYGITSKLFGLVNVISSITNETGTYDNPYFGSGQLNITDIASGALGVMRVINKIKYLSAEEIGLFVGGTVNFYTLHFRRGISIKDMRLTPPTGPGIPFSIASVTYKEIQHLIQPKMTFNIPRINLLRFETPRDLKQELSLFALPEKTKAEQEKRSSEVTYKVNENTGTIDFKNIPHPVFGFKQTVTPEYKVDEAKLSHQDMLRKIKDKEGIWEIGSLYVLPVTADKVSPKYVPFQFNPTIQESGMSARYTAVTVLSRIGNLQSFVGVDNLNVTLNTSYFPVSRIKEEPFSMQDIQLIELVYRSLVLPWFSSSETEASQYRYSKPPLIKVIMGNKSRVNKSTTELKTTNAPYSNLLTYPDDVLGDKKGSIQGDLRHFKTFIATSCSITRDESMPYFLDKDDDYLLKDTFGFNVSMNLTEVTPSYHQIFPNFRDYYDRYTERA